MQFDITCKKHPRYLAKREPKSCDACWTMYLMRREALGLNDPAEGEVAVFTLSDAKIGIQFQDGA